MSELGIQTNHVPMTNCIFLNVYYKNLLKNNEINNMDSIPENKTVYIDSDQLRICKIGDPPDKFWFRPEVYKTDVALPNYNKGLKTTQFNQTIKEIQFDDGYEFSNHII